MAMADEDILQVLADRAVTLERLLERHLGFDLLARFEALLDDGIAVRDEAGDLLRRMEGTIMDLEDDARIAA
ncbi:MAG: hypothetical protein KDG89_06200 [Geminicoccaceae bacterium]|nr:hypothetical protein [Geminicoccaceae bacterium]